MATLSVDLDARVQKAPRFKATTVAEYFRKSSLGWWKPEGANYQEQFFAIKHWLKLIHPVSIIEFGPGFGRITDLLSKREPDKLILVEVNQRACSILRARFPAAKLVSAAFNELAWQLEKDKHYLAVAIEVLVHVPDIRSLIKNIYTSLKPGGLFLTSITPLDWYKAHWNRPTTIHRGIDQQEFERFVSKLFRIEKRHTTKHGQQITYLLRKKSVA